MGSRIQKGPDLSSIPDDESFEVRNTINGIKRTFLQNGTTIGKYEIIEEIDRGGMAVVYKARQKDLDRDVALKVLPANITINDSFVDRFLSEAQAVAKLHHPNIVNIYEVAVENNVYFIAMDYIDGKNLFYYLNENKPKLVEVLEIIRVLALALQSAHDKKILHRDLKLNNVIMRGNKTPILIDFGLAKALGTDSESSNYTKTGEIAGSPSYMAPERIYGTNVDERSDICSLGIMLYEMLTFQNPYLDPRSLVQTTKNVVEANPVRPRTLVHWLPVEVESITLKAMSADPNDRYSSMQEFADDIKRYQDGEPVLASPPSPIKSALRFVKKNWAPFVIGTMVFAFTILLLLLLSYQSSKEKSGWRLAHYEKFNDLNSLDGWTVFREGRQLKNKGDWSILDSTLYIESNGYTFIRLDRSFTRDIRVEFDVKAGVKDIFNMGAFFYGVSPTSGFAAHIHNGGEILNGFTLPETEFLLYDYDPVKFNADSSYHVVIEREGTHLTFSLNDIVISEIDHLDLPLGKKRNKLGFFVNGSSVMIDNLKIFRRGVPRLARPTMVADRFWQQGNFEDAFEEYNEVLLDLPKGHVSMLVRFKMIDCLLRLKRIEEARAFIADIADYKKLKDEYKAALLYRQGRVEEESEGEAGMVAAFVKLTRLYPLSQESRSVAIRMIEKVYQLYKRGSIEEAVYLLERYPVYFPEHRQYFGRLSLEIQKSIMWKDKKSALEIAEMIRREYFEHPDIALRASICKAKVYLSMRSQSKAVDLLNQAVATNEMSVAKWEAWMLLADIYEMNNKKEDALTIYSKVFKEAPRSLPESWLARIRMEEIAVEMNKSKKVDKQFSPLVEESYNLIEPRLIAQFYSNMITWKYFKNQWQLLYPGDSFYKYYLARKRLMQDSAYATGFSHKFYKKPTVDETWEDIRLNSIVQKIKED